MKKISRNRKVDVTVALVHYKTPKMLIKCIESIYKHTKGLKYEIVVLDNSPELSMQSFILKKFPKIKYIASYKNLYATGGNNEIFKIANGEYFLVLNPDMEFNSNAIATMKKYLDHNLKVAAVTCMQHYKNGELQKVCSKFFTPKIEFWHYNLIGKIFANQKVLDEYWYKEWDRKTTREVEVISDTIMMIRSSIANKLNLYDTKLKLMYMENDLCLRISKLDYKVVYVSNAKVMHHVGQSTNSLNSLQYFRIFNEDRLYYYKKHFGLIAWIFIYFSFQINHIFFFIKSKID